MGAVTVHENVDFAIRDLGELRDLLPEIASQTLGRKARDGQSCPGASRRNIHSERTAGVDDQNSRKRPATHAIRLSFILPPIHFILVRYGRL